MEPPENRSHREPTHVLWAYADEEGDMSQLAAPSVLLLRLMRRRGAVVSWRPSWIKRISSSSMRDTTVVPAFRRAPTSITCPLTMTRPEVSKRCRSLVQSEETTGFNRATPSGGAVECGAAGTTLVVTGRERSRGRALRGSAGRGGGMEPVFA